MQRLSTLILWSFIFACMLSPSLGHAQSQNDITRVCLLDNPGGNGSDVLPNCIMEPYPVDGGDLSSMPNGANTRYANYTHFKASRARVSGYHDVLKMQTETNLLDRGGIYSFANRTYFRPIFFDGQEILASQNKAIATAGVRLNAKTDAITPIDVFGRCRYISNMSDNDIFVPLRSFEEWKSFTDAAANGSLPGVTIKGCALPCPGDCAYKNPVTGEGGYYFGPSFADPSQNDTHNNDPVGSGTNYFATELPYAKEGTLWPSAAGKAKGLHQHVFKHKCYDRAVVAACFDNPKIYEKVETCTSSASDGTCSAAKVIECQKYEAKKKNCKTKDVQVCSKAGTGTKCADTWHSWTEVWQTNPLLTAGASQDAPDSNPNATRTKKGWKYPGAFAQRIAAYDAGGNPIAGRPAACRNDAEHFYTEVNHHQACKPKIASSGSSGPAPPPPQTPCGW